MRKIFLVAAILLGLCGCDSPTNPPEPISVEMEQVPYNEFYDEAHLTLTGWFEEPVEILYPSESVLFGELVPEVGVSLEVLQWSSRTFIGIYNGLEVVQYVRDGSGLITITPESPKQASLTLILYVDAGERVSELVEVVQP